MNSTENTRNVKDITSKIKKAKLDEVKKAIFKELENLSDNAFDVDLIKIDVKSIREKNNVYFTLKNDGALTKDKNNPKDSELNERLLEMHIDNLNHILKFKKQRTLYDEGCDIWHRITDLIRGYKAFDEEVLIKLLECE